MTPEERLDQLEQENREVRSELAQKNELIEHLLHQVKELQDQLSKNSRNSSLPPSSDRFVRQPKSLRTPSGKKPGGQPKHPGSTLEMSEQPDEIVLHQVRRCLHSQADLRAEPALMRERRQVVDVPVVRLLVQEHQAEQKWCPNCREVSVAAFPEAVTAPVQYGDRVGAIALYLVESQLLPWGRACEVLSDLLGVTLSQGTLSSLIQRAQEKLVGVEEQLKAALMQGQVMHQDETGLYVKGKRRYLHVASTRKLTHYAVHQSRGREALDEIGILPHFTGTSVHDGWRSYFLYENCSHALCNAHLLRDLTFIAEEYQQNWATEMKRLLLLMKDRVEGAKSRGETELDPLSRLALRGEYDRVLASGWQTNPQACRASPEKGSRKRHPAVNLLDRLQTGKEAVLAFLDHFAVPFDNNQAERDIRMVKVQQKVSGSFRSEAGVTAFCRIRSYLSTLRKQGLPLLTALEAVLRGQPLLPSFQ